MTYLHPLTVGAPGHGDHQAEDEKDPENPTKVRMRLCFHCFTTCALSHYSRPSAVMSVIKPYQALAASSSSCTSAQRCTEVTLISFLDIFVFTEQNLTIALANLCSLFLKL